MQGMDGDSIFDRIDKRKEVNDRFSQEKLKAFMDTLDLQPYIERAVIELCHSVKDALLYCMETENEKEGTCEFLPIGCGKQEEDLFFSRLKRYFGLQAEERVPEQLMKMLRERYIDYLNQWQFSFRLWREEIRIIDKDGKKLLRYVLTDPGEKVIPLVKDQLAKEDISILACGPVIDAEIAFNPKKAYVPLGEWVNTGKLSQHHKPVICFRAEPGLIRYALDRGILKTTNVQETEDGWNHLLIMENGCLESPQEEEKDEWEELRQHHFMDEETWRKHENSADSDKVIPNADNESALSSDDRLIVIYRIEHGLCIFCGSDQYKRSFIKGGDVCAKCKKPRRYDSYTKLSR